MLLKTHKLRLVALAAITLSLLSMGARAQTEGAPATAAAPPSAAPATAVLEQVVVTVQRRKEKLQDVPVAATAITAADIDARGIGNVADLASLAPNLQVSQAPGNSTAAQIAIRGSVTTNPALYWEPTVGMYVDGVYVGKTQGAVFDLVDLERVEVLRGPQGTLYGRNTLAGAINLVTSKPSGELGGSASVEVGNYNARVGKLSLDLPAFGPLKLTVGGRAETRDGWVKTTPGSSASELNSRDNKGARVAASLDLGKDLTFDYRYDRTKVDQNTRFAQVVRATVDRDFGFPSGIVVSPDGRQETATVDGPVFERMDLDGHSLTAEWRFNEHNALKYVAAKRDMIWEDGLDLDGSGVQFAHTSRLSNYRQTSHELQLLGNAGDWTYVTGAYLFKDKGFTANPQTFFYGAQNFDSRSGFTTDATSFYGQLDYKLSDKLTLTGGLRHTAEEKTVDRYNAMLSATGALLTTLIPQGTVARHKFSSSTPLLSLGYKFNEQVSAYARYSEGFKSGGFNGEAATAKEALTPFKPEVLKSVELGLKSTLLDGRAQLNVALFNNRSDDLQQAVFTAEGAAASNIRNIGKATMRGLEVEAAVRVNADLRLQLGYGYLSPKYKEYMELGVNVSDNRAVVFAPRHTLNLLVDGTLARTSLGTVRAMADYAFSSSHYRYPYQLRTVNPAVQTAGNTMARSAGFLNLRLALSGIDLGRYANGEIALWVRNATDKKHIANMIDFGPGFGNLTQAFYADPRTYGVSFSARF